MRPTNSNSSSNANRPAERATVRARLSLVLTATIAVFALATAAHAQRLPTLGSSGGKITGGPGVTSGNPGRGPGVIGSGVRFPGVTTFPQGGSGPTIGDGGRLGGKGPGTTVGGGGRPGGHAGGDRPSKPTGLKPVPVVTGVTTVTTATPATSVGSQKISKRTSNPQLNNPGSGSPSGSRLVRNSAVPPAGEQRYVPDEVLIKHLSSVPDAQINAIAQRMRLNRIESYTSGGITMFRGKILDGRPVPYVIRSLEAAGYIALPNYLYMLLQRASNGQQAAPDNGGELEQYALAKLRLPQAHALARGEKVLIAVIDSGVDVTHPE